MNVFRVASLSPKGLTYSGFPHRLENLKILENEKGGHGKVMELAKRHGILLSVMEFPPCNLPNLCLPFLPFLQNAVNVKV